MYWVLRTALISIAVLACLLPGCSGQKAGLPADNSSVPANLTEALQRIADEEARLARDGAPHAAAALPETQNGDGVWFAGPSGTFSVDGNAHTLTITSGSASLGNPKYLSYGLFKYSGNVGKEARHIFFDMQPDPTAEYTIYVVRYLSTPSWHELGTFTGNPGTNGLPADLPTNCVAPSGNVYAAVVVANQKSLVIKSLRVSDVFEIENNDSAGAPNQIPIVNGMASCVIDGQIGSGKPGGDSDGDSTDWLYVSNSLAGVLYLGFDYTNSTGRVDAYLYANDGTTLLDSGGLTDGDEYIVEKLPSAGAVLIKLECTSGWADYVIDARFDDGVYADVEPNDTSATGSVLGVPTFKPSRTGEVGPAGTNDGDSVDWFKTGGSPGQTRFKLFLDDKSAALTFELVAPDGTTVLNTGVMEQGYLVMERLLTSSQLFLRVSSAGDTTCYALSGYQSGVGLGTGLTESEPNNSTLASNPLPAFPFSSSEWSGSAGFGPVGKNYDGSRSDWSQFVTAGAGTVDLNLAFNCDDTDLDLYLYDGTENLIASDTTFGGTASLSTVLPGADTYYVEVRTAYGYSDYTLDGNFTP